MEQLTYCVPCLFGLEGLAAQELRRLGMDNVRAQDRRVFLTAVMMQWRAPTSIFAPANAL